MVSARQKTASTFKIWIVSSLQSRYTLSCKCMWGGGLQLIEIKVNWVITKSAYVWHFHPSFKISGIWSSNKISPNNSVSSSNELHDLISLLFVNKRSHNKNFYHFSKPVAPLKPAKLQCCLNKLQKKFWYRLNSERNRNNAFIPCISATAGPLDVMMQCAVIGISVGKQLPARAELHAVLETDIRAPKNSWLSLYSKRLITQTNTSRDKKKRTEFTHTFCWQRFGSVCVAHPALEGSLYDNEATIPPLKR